MWYLTELVLDPNFIFPDTQNTDFARIRQILIQSINGHTSCGIHNATVCVEFSMKCESDLLVVITNSRVYSLPWAFIRFKLSDLGLRSKNL